MKLKKNIVSNFHLLTESQRLPNMLGQRLYNMLGQRLYNMLGQHFLDEQSEDGFASRNQRWPNENCSLKPNVGPTSTCYLGLMSHYSAFFSVRGTDANVLNGSKYSRLSRERRRMQNNIVFLYSYFIILYICDSGNGALQFHFTINIYMYFNNFFELVLINLSDDRCCSHIHNLFRTSFHGS